RKRLVEHGHTASHAAGLPMLKHTPGGEPERIFVVGRFRGRLVGQRKYSSLAVGVAIELHAPTLSDERIRAFAKAPLGLLPVDDRPAQSALPVIGIERRKVVAVAAAESGIFLEQALLHIEAERLRFIVGVALLDVR